MATNRLAGTSSPYLLQHAENPVDWFPWGDEAFERARAADKPIFLSVGYAACHWCHVMERESFEDEETARFLNDHFVSVKVDREERPDVDAIYMDAVQAMTGGGGWPMSVWLTPDGRPFYAGTYFPSEARHGLPSFRQVIAGLAEAWATRRDEIEAQGGRLVEAIANAARIEAGPEDVTGEIELEALEQLRRAFDAAWGGFGAAPKFPQPMVMEFLLRMAVRGEADALEMVVLTLDRMASGGIHDHVGGGFSRYSVDRAWQVPHFEKMLYDNAQLAQLYTHAWLVTRNEDFADVTRRTLDYLLRDMAQPDGGFSSSQDADSEGVEGKYYAWTWDELVKLVDPEVAEAFGATPDGNWEATNVLHREPVTAVAARHGLDPNVLESRVEAARATLLEARARRTPPATDDKVLTAWNALAIRAFADAGRALAEPRYLEAATRCAGFLWEHLRDQDGRLLRAWRDGASGGPGFADDHALLAAAFLVLYEATSDLRWFEAARELIEALLKLFEDREHGGFFQTGTDAETLIIRPKELYDNALPSGNSAAAEALLRLGLFTGDAAYEARAVAALALLRDGMRRAPSAFGHTLCALDLYVGPSKEVAIIGDRPEAETDALVREVVTKRFLPNVVVAVARPDDDRARSEVPLLADRHLVDGRPAAFVCERFVCKTPLTDPDELSVVLSS
jgi:uncharacterized protein